MHVRPSKHPSIFCKIASLPLRFFLTRVELKFEHESFLNNAVLIYLNKNVELKILH